MTNKETDQVLLKLILGHFQKISPGIAREKTDGEPIRYYDSDFYLQKMEGFFDNVDESRLRRIVFEHIDEINAIFFETNPDPNQGHPMS
ncbi:MAG: hypothetical protein ACM3SY_22250 [Candidatus Omnitrophota bacterium]